MTDKTTSIPDALPASKRLPPSRGSRKTRTAAWLFVAPAFVAYAAFVLVPLVMSFYYSFLRWDGIGEATFHGLGNYITVLTDRDLLQIIGNAFQLVLYFTLIPVGLGLAVASAIRSHMAGRFGTVTRTVLFLPQVIPLVAAGIAWSWMFASTGLVNQTLKAIGLSSWARGWLGDFVWALPAVGIIGAWVLLGLCTMLLVTGITKIDPSLYEAARLDGARPWHEFR